MQYLEDPDAWFIKRNYLPFSFHFWLAGTGMLPRVEKTRIFRIGHIEKVVQKSCEMHLRINTTYKAKFDQLNMKQRAFLLPNQ